MLKGKGYTKGFLSCNVRATNAYRRRDCLAYCVNNVILADKHHKEEFEELGIESMIAPCLCGTDDYANGKRLYSTPAQLMMVFRPGVGADAYYQIKLD